ncbi:hypothetical protein [Kitasatospora viridis]|uniref:asparagine synthase (glutamine-hydrolyzing) n=1 Tax=Kitasatospora viridis TaxID=281105 RepID=A0A561T6A7_9ACTN|nr:hypothetical protein [Kitasatospora viridis]TWF82642.1 hypothetical protein FHX73_14124 [Kitasatospora viridis]
MFIISNTPLQNSTAEGEFWLLSDDSARTIRQPDGSLLLFEGNLYPDSPVTTADLAQQFAAGRPAQRLAEAKGQYSGAHLDPAGGTVHAFNDHLGVHDVFIRQSGDSFALGNDLGALLRALPTTADELDETAVEDYFALEFALGGRTFARSVRRASPAALITAEARGGAPRAERYWQWQHEPAVEGFDDAVDAMYELLLGATRRIAALGSAPERWCLGLSGGLDSRVVGALARTAGLRPHGYFFGERESDAGSVTGQLATALGIEVRFPGRNREFPAHFATSLDRFPMANLEWCKYVTGRDRLPDYDALLSGRRAELFLRGTAQYFRSGFPERATPEDFYDAFAGTSADEGHRKPVCARLEAELRDVPGSSLRKRRHLGQLRMHSSWKDCALFRDFAGRPHYSPFDDLDVISYGLRLPPEWQRGARFHRALLERHFPHVAESRIRRDEVGNNDNKPLERWLSGNEDFLRAVRECVPDPAEPVPGERSLGSYEETARRISEGRHSRNEIHYFFRRLTVAGFRKAYL